MSSFMQDARVAAINWKSNTSALPDAARAPGVYGGHAYPFVLPVEFADLNLQAESRAWAIEFFATAKIPWHASANGGPSNHLLSSQVQCVNALAPFHDDATALKAIFGAQLGIDEVLPLCDEVDPGSFVSFEWIGPENYLSEWKLA